MPERGEVRSLTRFDWITQSFGLPDARLRFAPWPAHHERTLGILAILAACCAVLGVRARLWRRPACRADVKFAGALTVCFAAALSPRIPTLLESGDPGPKLPRQVLLVLNAFLLTFLFMWTVLATSRVYLERHWPAKVSTYLRLLRAPDLPSGLAITRGVSVGWVGLGAGLAWCRLGRMTRWSVPSVEGLVAPLGLAGFRTWPGWDLAAEALIDGMSSTWMLTAVPVALLLPFVDRRLAVWVAVPGAWLLAAFSLSGLTAFPMLPFYVATLLQALAAAWVFHRYDVLTCFVAATTAGMFSLGWPSASVYGGLVPWGYRMALGAWLIFALGGLFLALRPQVERLWSSLALEA